MEKLGFHIPSLIVYIVNFLLLLAILYFFLGLMVFLVFMVQPHGN